MKKLIKKLCLYGLALGVLFGLTVSIWGYIEYRMLIAETPIEERINAYFEQETYVFLEDINPRFVEAVIATEDARVLTRDSVLDFRSLGRAIWVNLRSFSLSEGGSTIPQQVAKNIYLDHSQSMVRKVTEYFLARDIFERYGNKTVLELYVNIIYYGDYHVGIYEASWGYFGVSPMNLNDNEATLLAGLPQSPANYELSRYLERALLRQEHVLNRMIDQGMIDHQEKEQILNEPLRGGWQ